METADNDRDCDLLSEQSSGLTRALLGSLDEITSACIVLNDRAEVRFCNEIAEELVTDNEDLYGHENRFYFSDGFEHKKFLSSLAEYGHSIPRGSKLKSRGFTVNRRQSTSPYHIMLIPLSTHPVEVDGNTREEPLIMVLIHDPESRLALAPVHYAREFALTKTETKVTKMIAKGMTPVQIAGKLSVSINTTRTHIRNIYRKIGVKSQIELVLKLAKAPEWFIKRIH